MATKHELLVEKAEEALRNVHSDTSVSVGTNIASLEDLRSEIAVLIDALQSDDSGDDE